MRLEDRVAIITGAGSGIGRASAILFAREGAQVALVDVDRAGAERTAAEIHSSASRDAAVLQADVSASRDVQAVVQTVIDQFGRLDVLLNSAGIEVPGRIHETSESDFDRIVAVNMRGVFLMCKYSLPSMMNARRGSIINLGSVAGLAGSRNHHAYSATKGGIVMLTRSMAVAYGQLGIRVNCICPGPIMTPMLSSWTGGTDSAVAETAGRVPMRRLGQPEEVADAALYLASDESSFVNGASLTVDGGLIA